MLDIAFIIPCYNEQESIGLVISEIRSIFPSAGIFVCDNNSNDRTSEVAASAGATVLFEREKGKGNAVRRLLRDVDASLYVMVDGDNPARTSVKIGLQNEVDAIVLSGLQNGARVLLKNRTAGGPGSWGAK